MNLEILKLGPTNYETGLQLQSHLHDLAKTQGRQFVLCLEHHSVITAGKHADQKDLYFAESVLKEKDIAFVRTQRGGQLTAHNPGQLVVYPILALEKFKLRTRAYVGLLERSMIDTLSQYQVQAHIEPALPGVWIGPDKIGAIGVRIKNRISMHGVSLNVSNDLGIFSLFLPCGIQNRGVTSLLKIKAEESKNIKISEVCEKFLKVFLTLLISSGSRALLKATYIDPSDIGFDPIQQTENTTS